MTLQDAILAASARRGRIIGLAVKQGQFRLTETDTSGKRWKTTPLTEWLCGRDVLAAIAAL